MKKWQPHFVVAADGALEKVLAAGIPCDCGMGDFDTVSKDVLCHFEEDQNTKLLSFHLKRMRQMQSLLCSLQ